MASAFLPVPLLAPLVALFALVPESADACDPSSCYSEIFVSELSPINAAAIPIDGVLLLQWSGHGFTATDVIAGLELTVTENGQPVAGAIEDSQVVGVLVWRPAAPLKPGASHQVVGGFDNLESVSGYCAADLLELDFEFIADMGPSQPLPLPEVSAVESLETANVETLKTLVCCDYAFPKESELDCGIDDGYVSWLNGSCVPTAGHGSLSVLIEAPLAVAPSTAALVVTSVRVDGEVVRAGLSPMLGYRQDTPFCTEVEQRNLATGETVTAAKQCHGDAVAAQLGPQELDPTPLLADQCSGPAYVCEVTETPYPQWDPDKCTPYEPAQETETPTTSDSDGPTAGESDTGSSGTAGETPDGDKGCACTSAPADPTGLLGLLGLGLLRRRRPAVT